ncbi:hypothetical protein DSBG_3249 [Desulfosporosinus sp. BG]|nr:hypothetical protein DSBG_3249 [Desulfosporosinus sp. BG]
MVDLNTKEINEEQKSNDVNSEIGKQYPDCITIEREKIPVSVLQLSYPLSKIANILLWIGESIIVFLASTIEREYHQLYKSHWKNQLMLYSV